MEQDNLNPNINNYEKRKAFRKTSKVCVKLPKSQRVKFC